MGESRHIESHPAQASSRVTQSGTNHPVRVLKKRKKMSSKVEKILLKDVSTIPSFCALVMIQTLISMQLYNKRCILWMVTHSPCMIFDVFAVKAGINLSHY